jgi:hypothetical protein
VPTKLRPAAIAILAAVAAVGLGLAGFLAAGTAAPARIVIDDEQRFQTMLGWQVTARAWEQDKVADRYDASWLDHRDAILRVLVEEAGISRMRLQVQSGSENPVDWWARFFAGEIGYLELKSHYYEKINDNDDPMQADPAGFFFTHLDYQVENMLLPMLKLVEARGERLEISLCFVDFRWTKLKGTLSLAQNPEEYAEFILQVFRHLEDRWGIVPDTLEVILEPDNSDHWRGRQIGEGAVAALRRLAPEGFAPRLVLPSTANARRAVPYFDEAVGVPGVSDHLFSLSYHRYDGAKAARALAQIRARAAAFGIPAEMLEYTKGGDAELAEDLTVANAAGWQLYSMAGLLDAGETPPDPSSVLVHVQPGPDGLRAGLSPQGRVLAPYFRTIRPGAVRIGATSSDRGFVPVAFLNRAGDTVAVIRSDRGGAVEVAGLPPGRYVATVATRQQGPDDLPEAEVAPGGTLAATVPPGGVLAIRAVASD